MSSVSVHRSGGLDARRGSFERSFLWVLGGVLPPAKENQRAADFLLEKIGPNNPFVQWVVVRPDSLLEGEVSEYALHEGLVNSLFAPGSTNMANVAHFMCELVTKPEELGGLEGQAARDHQCRGVERGDAATRLIGTTSFRHGRARPTAPR